MVELFYLLVLLILSGVFSGSETALVALSIGRVEGLVREGRHGAAALYRLKKDTVRPLDRQDAEALKQRFHLEDE